MGQTSNSSIFKFFHLNSFKTDRRCWSWLAMAWLLLRMACRKDFQAIEPRCDRHQRWDWNPKHRNRDFPARFLAGTADGRFDDCHPGVRRYHDAVPATVNLLNSKVQATVWKQNSLSFRVIKFTSFSCCFHSRNRGSSSKLMNDSERESDQNSSLS